MAGPAWKPEEKLIVVQHNQQKYSDSTVHKLLEERGFKRTLEAVRSQLYELRKDSSLFDREVWAWKNEGVEWLKGQVKRQAKREADEEA
jgi:hypothetical protein